MKYIRYYIALIFACIIGILLPVQINAATVLSDNELQENVENMTGLIPSEVESVESLDQTQIYSQNTIENSKETEKLYGSAEYNSKWDKYSTNYFYNQMNQSQQDAWIQIQNMCNSYLNGKQNIDSVTKFVCIPDTKEISALDFARIFRFSNPQFYFLNTSMRYYIDSNSKVYVAFGVYTAFQNGEKRSEETQKVLKQITEWEDLAEQCENQEQKVKLIHDLIVEKVDYNYAIQNSDFNEDQQYSQSAYSVLCGDLTVCAGYAQTFELICNGAGIDCISVTSANHEWNKVRINDSWYNVDCTWADQASGVYYDYFERNDSVYSETSHMVENFWKQYMPLCTLDSNAQNSDSGSLPSITKTTAMPEVNVCFEDGKYRITITCNTSNSKIYTTQDGNRPSAANTRSCLYVQPYYVDSLSNFAAIATSDTYWDSEVYYVQAKEIKYDGNGATGGTMTSDYEVQPQITLKKNAFSKKGYSFVGWNTKADGSGIAYADNQVINTEMLNGNVTLYAQWKELPAVTTLSAKSAGVGKVVITWNQVNDVDGYLIYAKKDGQYAYCGMTTLGTSYTDVKASMTDYNYYWVYPYVTDGNQKLIGKCSNYVYAKGTPLAVKELIAKSAGKNKVTISWKKNSDVNGYIIYKKNASTGKFEYLYMTTSTTYTDTSASATDYNFYRIYPYVVNNGTRVLGTSNTYVYAKGILSAVSNLKATGGTSGVALSWNKVSTAEGYVIYKKNASTGKFEYYSMTSKTNYIDSKASRTDYSFYRVYAYYKDDSGKRVLGLSDNYVYAKKI